MKTLEEQIAHLENELQLQDVLNLNLQEKVKELESIVSGLANANSFLRNGLNFQAKFMLEISRIVGEPPKQNMESLAKWIKEHWKQ